MTAEITFLDARYHRNGVAGAGYYSIRMRCAGVDLGAIVFDQADHVAILDDEGDSWRCEDFQTEVRAFIASPTCHDLCWPDQRVAANDR